MFTSLDLYIFVGFAWIVLGIPLLFLNKKNTLITPIYGVSILLVFGLALLDNFIKPRMFSPDLTKIVLAFTRNSYFLVGPTLWLYCLTIFNEIEKKAIKQFFHFVPFIIWVIVLLVIPNSRSIPQHQPASGFKITIAFIRDFSSILSRVIYSVLILIKVISRSKKVKDYYSNLSSNNTLSWLQYITLFYLILFISDIILFIVPTRNLMLRNEISIFARIAPSMIFIFFFTIFSQNQSVPHDKKNRPKEKYKKSGLKSNDSKAIFNKILKTLSDNKLFNNPDFNLDILAEGISETRHIVSEVINKHANENFYCFINRYRLNEFIKSVKENRYPNFTILAIAYECGFKSTSAFYTFFKKEMGMTPKEYLKLEKAC